jgi:hypothetical protein
MESVSKTVIQYISNYVHRQIDIVKDTSGKARGNGGPCPDVGVESFGNDTRQRH